MGFLITYTGGGSVTYKDAVRLASTANVPLTGATPLVIDTLTVANKDRILLKDQLVGSQNGIYEVTISGGTYTLTRTKDADTSKEVVTGMIVPVSEGGVNLDKNFQLITNSPIVVNTTSLVFVDTLAALLNKADRDLANLTSPTAVNQLLRGQDGTFSAPAYSFISDTDLGLYRSAANELGVAALSGVLIPATPSTAGKLTIGTSSVGGGGTLDLKGGNWGHATLLMAGNTVAYSDGGLTTLVNGQFRFGNAGQANYPQLTSIWSGSSLANGADTGTFGKNFVLNGASQFFYWGRYSQIHAAKRLSVGAPFANTELLGATLSARGETDVNVSLNFTGPTSTLSITGSAQHQAFFQNVGVGDYVYLNGLSGTKAQVTSVVWDTNTYYTGTSTVTLSTAIGDALSRNLFVEKPVIQLRASGGGLLTEIVNDGTQRYFSSNYEIGPGTAGSQVILNFKHGGDRTNFQINGTTIFTKESVGLNIATQAGTILARWTAGSEDSFGSIGAYYQLHNQNVTKRRFAGSFAKDKLGVGKQKSSIAMNGGTLSATRPNESILAAGVGYVIPDGTSIVTIFTPTNRYQAQILGGPGDYLQFTKTGQPALIARIVDQAPITVSGNTTQYVAYTMDKNISAVYADGTATILPAALVIRNNDHTDALEVDYKGDVKLGGGLRIKSRHGQTGTITVTVSDIYIGCNSSGGGVTVNLPAATTAEAGKKIIIKDEGGNATTNNISIVANGSDVIDGSGTQALVVNYESVTLVCDGVNGWFII